jgi:uncharacterized protein
MWRSLLSSVLEYIMPGTMITGANPRREGLIEALLLYMVLFLPALIASGSAVPSLDDPAWHLNYWILGLPQAVFLLWGLGRRGVLADRGCKKTPLSVVLRVPALAVAALGAGWILLIVMALPSMVGLGAASDWKSLPYSFTRPALLPLAAFTCIVTGYREETFFRGWLQPDLEESGFRSWLAILVSAALFAVLHAWEGWRGITATFVVGILFAWRYSRRRDLHEIALAHGAYNFIAMALSLLASPRPTG